MQSTAPTTNTLTVLKNTPGFLSLAVSVLLLGFATSFAAPYLSLFAVREANMTPLMLGAFLTCTALGGIVISTFLARLSDRLPTRKPIVIAAILAATLGYGSLAFTTNFALLLVIGALLLGTGAAAFPQVFALAKNRAGSVGEQGVTTLRAAFSLAWVIGPGIGAAILAGAGFHMLFLATAVCFALAALPVLFSRVGERTDKAQKATPAHGVSATTAGRSIVLVAGAFVLYGASMHMGSTALPIHVTRDLGGTDGSVGLIVGLCALLEIPVMLSFVLLKKRPGNETLILWGLVLFALYYLVVALAPSVLPIVLAQAIRAVVIAILATLGMAYVQELMPGRLGVATTLYSNTMNAGSLLSGLGIGAVAGAFGYGSVFAVCLVLSALAWTLLMIARRAQQSF
ncbi:sugar efflux transporter [Deinococcus yavapaiensis]|uniref:SET family sugar efflux transporter-like MFS transporter n=1 Tax=Deinococcus yavapaiensis KR-236 TaxID=694435 RepID=A0A318SAT0_9DEIO|nr:sugar efflux transporter [Deinococcus yavapaiensis]PYE53648.1 SET family sugar efflux transporter-like MFS transporter [Deinococcus yavapaiensis KR-236]